VNKNCICQMIHKSESLFCHDAVEIVS